MGRLHAKAGDVLVCQGGHPVALFTRDVYAHAQYREGDLDFIHYDTPEIGASEPICALCSEPVHWAAEHAVRHGP